MSTDLDANIRELDEQIERLQDWVAREMKKVSPKVDPRDPDYSRPGIFAHHNCWKCKNGSQPNLCPTPDRPGNCGYPHARND